ncbi:MAG: class I SAM-dependent methyltransferase [Puniceicoccales bacterium]
MPRIPNIIFGARFLTPDKVAGKRIVDVGACDFNGSIRPLLESYGPAEYIGVDVLEGPSVDRVMDANNLVAEFGSDSFDIVICMEMMEHTPDWRKSLSAIKGVCKPGGVIVMTTPALGHPYHGYPDDYWRYSEDDWRTLFQDCEVLAVETDPTGPGTCAFVRKPENFHEADLSQVQLHSMVAGERITSLQPVHWDSKNFKKVKIQQFLANTGRDCFLAMGRSFKKILGLSGKS